MARQDDDDAPWLAEAAPAPQTRVSRRSLVWTVLIFLVLAAIVAAGTAMLVSNKDAGSTQGYMNAEQAPLILAEPGPYKLKPVGPSGMLVEGQDQTLYAAGEGIDQGSVIDETAAPEDPLPRPGSLGPPIDLVPPEAVPPPGSEANPAPLPAVPALAPPPASRPPLAVTRPPPIPRPAPPTTITPPATTPLPATPPKPTPRPEPPTAKPGTVQLGAFSSEAKASAVWAQLAARHGLAGFTKQVSATQAGGQTLWRLRGRGNDAPQLCAKLKAAGEPCTVVN